MSLSGIQDWLLSLGAAYGVNPYVFGAIYVGAIPFFLASVAWLIRRRRAGRSITVPVLCAGFFFTSAYLYLALVGHDIPIWVWLFLGALIAYGAWSTVRDIRRKLGEGDDGAEAGGVADGRI